MPKSTRTLLLIGAAAVGLMVGALAGVGAAGAATKATAPARTSSAPVSGTDAAPAVSPQVRSIAPAGYTIVHSGSVDNPNGDQTLGDVACPSGTVDWGGGVLDTSTSLAVNINGSFPLDGGPGGWEAFVNNASGADDRFTVYAVCADAPAKYSVVISPGVDNPNGTQTSVDAVCPKATEVIGGGALGSSTSTAVGLNSSWPEATSKLALWAATVNNTSGADDSATAYAICAKKPSSYVIVRGSEADNPGGSRTEATADCSSKTSILSVGGRSSAVETDVSIDQLNADVDSVVVENNASPGNQSLRPYAVCAN
jgi:hypothetical protein